MATKILIVVPQLDIGGAESYVLDLALSLTKRGYKIIVASWGGSMVKILNEQGIKHYRIPIRFSSFFASWMLTWVIKKEKIDLIHANSSAAGRAVYPASKRMHIPWIITAHGLFGRRRRDRVMEKANRIICVSNFTRAELERDTDIPKHNMEVIHNGIDITKFTSQGYRNRLRTQWNIGDNEFVVGIVARIGDIYGKGHDDLLQAMIHGSTTPTWKLLVVGKGAGLQALEQRVNQLKLNERVIFCGHRTDVSRILEVTDALALPSRLENFPLSILEAMVMGKPIVAYAVGGICEAVSNYDTGFLVPKGDIATLAARINELQGDPKMAIQIGERGRQKVWQEFDHEQMVDKVIALYTQILNENYSS